MSITAHPMGPDTYVIVCTECGPVSSETVESVTNACVLHLVHDHDAPGVQMKMADSEWEDVGGEGLVD